MGRDRKNKNEVRIVRGISVSPTFWKRFKAWCRGRSMSEMIEIAILRMMDEKNDVLSLTLQTEELRNKISSKRFEYKKIQAELENEEHNLAVLEERISEIKTSEKAVELRLEQDYDFMRMVVSDKLGTIRRSFPSWMHEEGDRAAYMPSIETVKERSTVLDNYNNVKTNGSRQNIFDKRLHLGLPKWFKGFKLPE